jgi:dolichol-phosphate mannosyltransferase
LSMEGQEQGGTAPRDAQAIQRAVVVIPSYNEKDTIAEIVAAALAEQANVDGIDLHVLVSDSHSLDGTIEIVEQMGQADPHVHLLDVMERGIGLGLYRGFVHAVENLGADILIEMDADFQHNPADIPMLISKVQEGYELVVGSRFLAESANRMPFHRRVLSVVANQVIRFMLGLKGVTEITTSYRAMTREAFLRVPPDSVPWHERSFIPVPVFLVRLLEYGANATEVPITMHPRTRGYSKMVYWKYIRDILRFSIRSRFRPRN